MYSEGNEKHAVKVKIWWSVCSIYQGMERGKCLLWKVGLLVLAMIKCSYSTLSPSGVNYEGINFASFGNSFPLYHRRVKL